MSQSATKEGTTRYSHRFAERAADGHFREAQRMVFSSVGIGTYLGQPNEKTDEAYTSSVVASVESGINIIDSAINYRFQRSERSIGAALKQLRAKGFEREEIVLCTKGGYLTPDDAMPADPNEYFFREYIQQGIFNAKDLAAGSHCMAPKFLKDQLGRSLKNLGVECIDVYYLHNPETQLSEIAKLEFLQRVRTAFEFLNRRWRLARFAITEWPRGMASGRNLEPATPCSLPKSHRLRGKLPEGCTTSASCSFPSIWECRRRSHWGIRCCANGRGPP